jgi:hypothetical protein
VLLRRYNKIKDERLRIKNCPTSRFVGDTNHNLIFRDKTAQKEATIEEDALKWK